jgi:hypothetical protein
MHNYADLLIEIDVIREQIRFTELDLENWSFDGKFGAKFGANTSLIQSEKKLTSLGLLRERLDKILEAKERIETLLNRFDGLEYKIAFKRIVEHKTHQEIADELGYSHQYIKETWANAKRELVV